MQRNTSVTLGEHFEGFIAAKTGKAANLSYGQLKGGELWTACISGYYSVSAWSR
jgi:ParD-like antitoxin of type II ParDE toxin-antitoxin system